MYEVFVNYFPQIQNVTDGKSPTTEFKNSSNTLCTLWRGFEPTILNPPAFVPLAPFFLFSPSGMGAGTDVMILKNFSPNFLAKKLEFLTQNRGKLCKILIITLVFEINANFSPKIVKNRRKLSS
jgi:hypothetical protein